MMMDNYEIELIKHLMMDTYGVEYINVYNDKFVCCLYIQGSLQNRVFPSVRFRKNISHIYGP